MYSDHTLSKFINPGGYNSDGTRQPLKQGYDPRLKQTDNVYFNAKFINESKTSASKITFVSNRNDNIVDAGNMYYLIVESFSIPSKTLPIFKFDNNQEADANNTRPYTVKVAGGALTPLELKYAGDYINPAQTPPGIYGPGNIYHVRQFLDMVNTAISVSAINVAEYITLDASNRFVLNNGGLAANTVLYMSAPLYNLFNSFEATFNGFRLANGEDFALVFGANPQVSISRTFYAWNDIESILLFSSSLPVVEQNFTNRLGTGVDEKFKAIADFIPYSSAEDIVDRSDYNFFSIYPKLIDLRSDMSLTSVTFNARVLRKNGDLEDIYLFPSDQARVKLRFVKRAIFNNEYNISELEKRLELNPIHNYH